MKAVDESSLACLHRVERGTYWDDEVERLESAIAIARSPQVSAASTICRLLDVHETEPTGPFDPPATLEAIWEWADLSLHEFVLEDRSPDLCRSVADEIEQNVTAALSVLHGIGKIHLDVAPNNILRIAETWKLADLDSCLDRGTLSSRGPIDERWMHPERRKGIPVRAREEFDFYGLEQILRALRS